MLLNYFFSSKKTNRTSRSSRSSIVINFNQKDKKIISTPLEAISHRIKEVVTTSYDPVEYDSKQKLTTDIEIVEVKLGSTIHKVRRVFLCSHPYQIGWVVDSDLHECMVCELPFSWKRFRRHCRGCGALVCQNCSPYKTTIPRFEEKNGSRVCINCFGFKADISNNTASNGFNKRNSCPDFNSESLKSDLGSVASKEQRRQKFSNYRLSFDGLKEDTDNRMASYQRGSQAEASKAVEELERREKQQALDCEHAYKVMRGFVPLDLQKSTLQSMMNQGLPESIAQRILTTKALWMLTMHPEDISKIHIADLRSKYHIHGLDIIELQALWHWLQEKDWFDGPMDKLEWMYGIKTKLYELSLKKERNQLSIDEKRHSAYHGYESMVVYNVRAEILRKRYDQMNSYHTGHSPLSTTGANATHTRTANTARDYIHDTTATTTTTTASYQPRKSIIPTPSKPPKPSKGYRSDTLGLGLNSTPGNTYTYVPKTGSHVEDNIPLSGTNIASELQQENLTRQPFTPLVNPTQMKTTNKAMHSPDDSLSDMDEMDPTLSPYTALMKKLEESTLKANKSNTNLVTMVEDIENNENDENKRPDNRIPNTVQVALKEKGISPLALVDVEKSVSRQPLVPISNTDKNKGMNEKLAVEGNPFQQIVSKADTTSSPTHKAITITDFDDDANESHSPISKLVSQVDTPESKVLMVRKDSIPEPVEAITTVNIKKPPSARLPNIDENDEEMSFPNEVDDIPTPRSNPMNAVSIVSHSSKSGINLESHFDPRRQTVSNEKKKSFIQEFTSKTKKRFASFGVGGRSSTFFKPTPQQTQQSFINHLKAGEADFAKELLKSGCEKISPEEASKLLLHCVDNADNLLQPVETITLILDELHADVNLMDDNGRTPLSILFTDPIIGRLLISRGADVLMEDNAGSCALSISFEYGIEWMYDCWLSKGGERKLKESASTDMIKINKYVACLILGGYGSKAMEWIKSGQAMISPDEATQLFEICQGNFENMKEPVETFELLEFLGATFECV